MSNVVKDMELADLIARLNTKFGKDLSSYRLNCLGRRISLRMSMLRVDSLADYFEYLSSNREEIEHLLDTVTIHVTEFLRDAEVFEAVARDVLPAAVARAARGGPGALRVWSAGCSTGEEAYSLAIVILEYLRAHPAGVGLEVFATDISREACRVARRGIYDRRKLDRIPAPIRDRYFESVPEGVRVASEARHVVLFSVHDLFQPPRHADLDIVVCRNVLIHFDHVVRDEVLERFHGALGRGGALVLGKTEAITGAAAPLFELIDPRNKIYAKKCSALPRGGKR